MACKTGFALSLLLACDEPISFEDDGKVEAGLPHAESSSHAGTGVATVFLNFDGGNFNCGPNDNSQTGESSTFCELAGAFSNGVPPFNEAPFGCGTREACISQITTSVQALWSRWSVTFTSTRPTGDYQMVVIGGSAGAFLGNSIGRGTYDCGNENPSSIAFVFSEAIANAVQGPCALQYVIVTISQELAHLFGQCHNDNCDGQVKSIMCTSGSSNMCEYDWLCGSAADPCPCEGKGYDPYCPTSHFDDILGTGTQPGAPVVTFLAPTEGLTVPSSFAVQVQVTDDEPIATVELFANALGPLSPSSVEGNVYNFGVAGQPDGALALRAVATDQSGTSGETTVTVLVDMNQMPSDNKVGAPCETSVDCPGTCIQSDDRLFCTIVCQSSENCPDAYECSNVSGTNYCIPATDGGCGCKIGTAKTHPPGPFVLFLLLLGYWLGRRHGSVAS